VLDGSTCTENGFFDESGSGLDGMGPDGVVTYAQREQCVTCTTLC
jgi:hypothetical protein